MNWKRELRKISYKYRHYIANDSRELSKPLSISDEEKVIQISISIYNMQIIAI